MCIIGLRGMMTPLGGPVERKRGAVTTVLIVARRGSLRSGLYALIDSIQGIETLVLTDSQDNALRLAGSEPIGLAVLDGDLFHAQGWAALQQLRQRTASTRVILLLGEESRPPDDEQIMADAVLSHGILPSELVAHIERLLEAPTSSSGKGDKQYP